jgi:small-conductance mechanosensitive channel
MNQFFTAEQLVELGQRAWSWIQEHVLVLSSAVQLLVIVVALGVSMTAARGLSRWLGRLLARPGLARFANTVLALVFPSTWLVLLWIANLTAIAMEWPHYLLEVAVSLLSAWVVIRLVSRLAKDPVWSRFIAWTAWLIAALNILNLLGPTITILDSAAVTIGTLRISMYTVVKSTLALVVLLSVATYVAGLIESRIRTSHTLSPSVQVLFSKSLKIVLISLAVLIAIKTVGIDLTALAVVGGAIGLGVGFGLQTVISNLISGVILLVDKSIKPGDVIAVGNTYGWVTALGGRYVSIVTRDGIEHLIPNETLITQTVENWTHSNNQTRLKVPVGIHYKSDVKLAIDLCIEAAVETERVLRSPKPVCLLVGFGDSSVDLELRFWIEDAHNGVQNVKSDALLKIWEKFHKHGIEIPYPQRDLHIRSSAVPVAAAAEPVS